MTEIQQVPVSSIDPESSVNVRRTGIEANVEKIKMSIQAQGFWEDEPLTLRPHPDPEAEYQYQYVVGQCRFKAALELGLETVPAIVRELDDDEALRRSWGENEARGALAPGDKAYWAERMYNKFSAEGLTDREAREKAADWMGISEQTFKNYFPLAFLPDNVTDMMNQGRLVETDGRLIAESTEQDDERMIERAEWLANQSMSEKKAAREVMAEAAPTASVSELDQELHETMDAEKRRIYVEIPDDIYEDFLLYGAQRGIHDPPTIASHIIAEAIRG